MLLVFGYPEAVNLAFRTTYRLFWQGFDNIGDHLVLLDFEHEDSSPPKGSLKHHAPYCIPNTDNRANEILFAFAQKDYLMYDRKYVPPAIYRLAGKCFRPIAPRGVLSTNALPLNRINTYAKWSRGLCPLEFEERVSGKSTQLSK